jgi:hypothetical protein
MAIGLAIIAGVVVILAVVGFVVMRRRQPPPPRPAGRPGDANQTVNLQKHNETGTDWRYRP